MAADINMKHNTKKGYFTIEAAIFLPILILGVLAVGAMILFCGTEEKMGQIALDELNKLAAEAYIRPAAPGAASEIERRLETEIPEAKTVWVDQFRYLYTSGRQNGQIYLSVKARRSTGLPIPFRKTVEIQRDFQCRGLIGKKNRSDLFSFDEMEQMQYAEMVWVFPLAGRRYHQKTCTYVSAEARQYILQQDIKREYEACSICRAEDLPIGSPVFCFPRAGERYHRGTCRVIERYVREIEKQEAKEKGYTPCTKCGGG